MTAGLDAPGTQCAFGTRCGLLVAGHGGFDLHHELPISLHGSPSGVELVLCPTHHRRQHSLVRYLVEADAGPRSGAVVRHFTSIERQTAEFAYQGWVAAGRPAVGGWSSPAAR